MVMYLSPFILGLSTLTASLHELLKKDTDFTWNGTYNTAFQHVKDTVVSDTTLRYFDPSLPMTKQVDASQVGLGAVLLQNNKPIAFAKKALTNTECHYANIGREMLTVVFGAERFRTYVYGRSFTIESDHKPLECYCAPRAMITSSFTTPVRKWPCLTPFLISVHVLALASHWTLPFTMLTRPQSGRKHFNKPSQVTPRCALS